MVANIPKILKYATIAFGTVKTAMDSQQQQQTSFKKTAKTFKRFKLFSKISYKTARIIYQRGKRKGIAIGTRQGLIEGAATERQLILTRLKKLNIQPHIINKVIKR